MNPERAFIHIAGTKLYPLIQAFYLSVAVLQSTQVHIFLSDILLHRIRWPFQHFIRTEAHFQFPSMEAVIQGFVVDG